jgi:hypothetical protein
LCATRVVSRDLNMNNLTWHVSLPMSSRHTGLVPGLASLLSPAVRPSGESPYESIDHAQRVQGALSMAVLEVAFAAEKNDHLAVGPAVREAH